MYSIICAQVKLLTWLRNAAWAVADKLNVLGANTSHRADKAETKAVDVRRRNASDKLKAATNQHLAAALALQNAIKANNETYAKAHEDFRDESDAIAADHPRHV